jgi:hypothetical protein
MGEAVVAIRARAAPSSLGLTTPLDGVTFGGPSPRTTASSASRRQIRRVLAALAESGFSGSTRVIYTSDHGEMLGEARPLVENTMFELVTVPLVVAGADVPVDQVARTNLLVGLYRHSSRW